MWTALIHYKQTDRQTKLPLFWVFYFLIFPTDLLQSKGMWERFHSFPSEEKFEMFCWLNWARLVPDGPWVFMVPRNFGKSDHVNMCVVIEKNQG
jgi:hypothetical protein